MPYINKGCTLIYLDEVGFDLSLSALYGYCRKNEKLIAITKEKGIRRSVMCAITINKVLGIKII